MEELRWPEAQRVRWGEPLWLAQSPRGGRRTGEGIPSDEEVVGGAEERGDHDCGLRDLHVDLWRQPSAAARGGGVGQENTLEGVSKLVGWSHCFFKAAANLIQRSHHGCPGCWRKKMC